MFDEVTESRVIAPAVAANIGILYGVTVKPDRMDALLRQPNLERADFTRTVRVA
jgi:hypothetical protein